MALLPLPLDIAAEPTVAQGSLGLPLGLTIGAEAAVTQAGLGLPLGIRIGGEPVVPIGGGWWFPFGFKIGAEPFVPRIEIIDTHDGERKRKRWEEQRLAKEELREQIRAALDSELAPLLEALAKPGPQPLEERIDAQALLADLELWRSVQEAARRHWDMLEADDEEVILLLMS